MRKVCRNGHLADRYPNGQCKDCHAANVAGWRERNRERYLASMAKAHKRRSAPALAEHVLRLPVSL